MGRARGGDAPARPPGGRCGKHWGTRGRGKHVEPSLDRRRGRGRRRSDVEEPLAVRGLLHDLGHQMTTLSYLVEAVRGDVELPGDAGSRLELLSLEMSRLLDIIAQEIPARAGVPAVAEVELRSLAGQVIKLARIAHEGSVILEPGPEVTVEASPALLWRVLTNVVDNAARAVGPYGRVGVTISARDGQAAVDEIDDRPGLGQGALESRAPESGGAHVRVVVPVRPGLAGPATPGNGRAVP